MALSTNQISRLKAPANDRATSKYQFEIPSKWYWKNGKKNGRKKLKLGIVCRGPGCKCGVKFGNKTKLNDHYLDIGCYSCKRCMIRFGSLWVRREIFDGQHGKTSLDTLVRTSLDTQLRFPTQLTLYTHRLLRHHHETSNEPIPEVEDVSLMRKGIINF